MEYSYTVQEVIEALGPSYRSVDVRAILVSLGDGLGWRSVVCIIRFSCESAEQVSEKQGELKASLALSNELLGKSLAPEHNSKPFRGMNIELSSYDFGKFGGIVARLGQGKIDCGSRGFQLWEELVQFDLSSQRMGWRNDPYAMDYGEWHTFLLGEGQVTSTLVSPEDRAGQHPRVDQTDLDRWSREAGFSTFRDVCAKVLEAPWGQGKKFEIRAPIYARVDHVRQSGNSLLVEGHYRPRLGPLTLECSVHGYVGTHHTPTPNTRLGQVSIDDDAYAKEIMVFSKTMDLETPPESGMATATLFKRRPIRFDLSEKRESLRSGAPLFQAYTAFVPESDLDEYFTASISGEGIENCQLYRRFKTTDKQKRAEELLEYVTSHILGLCRLNPIPLSNARYDSINGGFGCWQRGYSSNHARWRTITCSLYYGDAE